MEFNGTKDAKVADLEGVFQRYAQKNWKKPGDGYELDRLF